MSTYRFKTENCRTPQLARGGSYVGGTLIGGGG